MHLSINCSQGMFSYSLGKLAHPIEPGKTTSMRKKNCLIIILVKRDPIKWGELSCSKSSQADEFTEPSSHGKSRQADALNKRVPSRDKQKSVPKITNYLSENQKTSIGRSGRKSNYSSGRKENIVDTDADESIPRIISPAKYSDGLVNWRLRSKKYKQTLSSIKLPTILGHSRSMT